MNTVGERKVTVTKLEFQSYFWHFFMKRESGETIRTKDERVRGKYKKNNKLLHATYLWGYQGIILKPLALLERQMEEGYQESRSSEDGGKLRLADKESSDDNIVGSAESQPMRSMFIEVKVCTLPIATHP